MKMTLLELGKKAVFPQFLKNPSNSIDVSLTWVFSIDEDFIKVNNAKNIKFLGQDLVNIALKVGRCVEQPKKHYLVLEMAVSSLEGCFLFIALFYPYSMVYTCEVKLDESFGST